MDAGSPDDVVLLRPGRRRRAVFRAPERRRGDGPPFSGAVRVGNTLYLSGDIGLDENRKVPAAAKDEARLLLESVQRTLKEAGFEMDDLIAESRPVLAFWNPLA